MGLEAKRRGALIKNDKCPSHIFGSTQLHKHRGWEPPRLWLSSMAPGELGQEVWGSSFSLMGGLVTDGL